MRNFIQPGDSLAVAVPYAGGVTAGQGVLVGALFGVAAVDGAQNAVIEAQTQGVFDLTKQPALAITAGARVFWDDTNRRITTTATSNYHVGIATQAENHIKSWKTHLAADRTSCHRGPANQLRLMLHTGAYWLMWSLRRLMPARSSWRVAQFDTLRLRLLKIAAQVVAWKTKLLVRLPSAFPDQAILRLVLERLPRLVI